MFAPPQACASFHWIHRREVRRLHVMEACCVRGPCEGVGTPRRRAHPRRAAAFRIQGFNGAVPRACCVTDPRSRTRLSGKSYAGGAFGWYGSRSQKGETASGPERGMRGWLAATGEGGVRWAPAGTNAAGGGARGEAGRSGATESSIGWMVVPVRSVGRGWPWSTCPPASGTACSMLAIGAEESDDSSRSSASQKRPTVEVLIPAKCLPDASASTPPLLERHPASRQCRSAL
jgi:hypothetical protein